LGTVFLFCVSELVFSVTEGAGSRFHVFPLPDSLSAVLRASCPVFIFCAPGRVLGVTEGVGPRFRVLRFLTRFWQFQGRRVPFSCFARPHSLSAKPRASAPIFMFCATELVLGGTEDVGSRFHVLRSRTHFQLYQGRRVPFSRFARPDSFSAVPRALGLVFKFCAP
jgi:hypothetical protein